MRQAFMMRRRPGAWERLWTSPVHRRWGELMAPLLELGDDGLIASTDLREVYRFSREDEA
jgi:hypothetical protein